jgi:PIN domain nuclease of toxin-antitoxin system
VRLLLDTHTLIWAMLEPDMLSANAATLLADPSNALMASIASLWEITIKIGTGKMVIPGSDIDSIIQNLDPFRIQLIPVLPSHLLALQALPRHHKDPFDRILIAHVQRQLLFRFDDSYFSLRTTSTAINC